MELRSVIIQAGSRRSSAEIDLNAVFAIHTTSDCCFLGDRLQSGRLPYAVSAMHVCLVCDVGVLWPNSWIRMPLGMEVSLGLGHNVLDGDPVRPQERGTAAPPPLFGSCVS